MLPAEIADRGNAAARVHRIFARWKRHKLPDETALYHTKLDILYGRRGWAEKFALVRLRWTLRSSSGSRSR